MFLEYAGYSHMFSNSICEMCGQVAEGCQTAALEQACLWVQMICENRGTSTSPCSGAWEIHTRSQLKTRVYKVEVFTQFIHKMAGQESQMCNKQSNKNGNGYAEPGKLSNSICAYEFLIKEKEKPHRAKGTIGPGN